MYLAKGLHANEGGSEVPIQLVSTTERLLHNTEGGLVVWYPAYNDLRAEPWIESLMYACVAIVRRSGLGSERTAWR